MHGQRVTTKGRLVPFDDSLFIYMTEANKANCVYDLHLVELDGIWYKPELCQMIRENHWANIQPMAEDGTMSFVCQYITEERTLGEVLHEQLNS